MKVSFNTSQTREWLPLDVVCRILNRIPASVLLLAWEGKLHTRMFGDEVRIDSSSLDRYCESRPLVQQAPPPTYEKTRHGVRLVIE
jgi:hypothetical protein